LRVEVIVGHQRNEMVTHTRVPPYSNCYTHSDDW